MTILLLVLCVQGGGNNGTENQPTRYEFIKMQGCLLIHSSDKRLLQFNVYLFFFKAFGFLCGSCVMIIIRPSESESAK